MKIGFIVGRTDEVYDDEWLLSLTPKKYLVNGYLHVDVAIAMTVKLMYPNITVDIILPNELSISRLKKNYVNFPIGYDIINANIGDPYIKKFSTTNGYNKLLTIYKSKASRIFPPYSHLEFIWNKDRYMEYYKKRIPINPSIYITNQSQVNKILKQIKNKKWNKFIIKPIGATTSDGFATFTMGNNLLEDLTNYLNNNQHYSKFIIQELIRGFKTHGEIRIYWIDNKFSYAVNTIDKEYDYIVNNVSSGKILDKCKKIGESVVNNMPPIIINNHIVNPVMVRTDLTCCLNNTSKKQLKYYLNEIEHQDAGTFVNFEQIEYPIVTILADTFVKKANELKSIQY
jgi:hypothetical protein